jgi:hypothetical protein
MRCPTIGLSLCAALLCCSSGCLFVQHTTRVVRNKEPIHPAQFESERAQQFFVAGVHELQAHKKDFDVQVSAVPFLWWYSSTNELSDSAVYNDQISACDTNGDGIISMQEALAYRAIVAEQIRLAEKAKADQHDSPPTPGFTSQRPPCDPPPALIHVATQTSGSQ